MVVVVCWAAQLVLAEIRMARDHGLVETDHYHDCHLEAQWDQDWMTYLVFCSILD
jgi:hypothetical protein